MRMRLQTKRQVFRNVLGTFVPFASHCEESRWKREEAEHLHLNEN